MAHVPNRGDIIHLQFDPASGREMKGPHFCLVLSGKLFNQQGLAMVSYDEHRFAYEDIYIHEGECMFRGVRYNGN